MPTLLALLTTCALAVSAQDTPSPDPSLVGAWQSRGYGFAVEVHADGRVEALSVSPLWTGPSPFTGEIIEYGIPDLRDDGKTLHIRSPYQPYAYIFDRIDALPAQADTEVTPMFVFDVFDEIFSEHYVFFDERDIDWPSLATSARARVSPETTDAELFEILSDLLAPINDGHITLSGEVEGRMRMFTPGRLRMHDDIERQAAANGESTDDLIDRRLREGWTFDIPDRIATGGSRRVGRGQIQFGLIGDDIGYLNIRGMGGYTESDDLDEDLAALDELLDPIMTVFGQLDAVIVDIAFNGGGIDFFGDRIAARFAKERTHTISKYAGDARDVTPVRHFIKPSSRPSFHGPVWLVTSQVTASAAEVFTMSMRVLPQVTHVGMPTCGVLSDMLEKPLPNGWSLTLSNEIYLDHEGVCWEVAGVPPEVEIPIFATDDIFKGHVEAIAKVVEMIREG